MTPTLDQLAPGLVAKLNLVMDLLLLLAALKLVGCEVASPATLAALGGWVAFGLGMSHYDANAYARARGLEVSVLALIAAAAVVCAALASHPLAVELAAAAVLCWLGATVLRLSLFRGLARGTAPRQEIIVVGAGALALETAHRARKGQQQRLLGLLPFAGENVRTLTELGRAMELEKVLRRTPVDEVYIAGDVLTQGSEMRRAVSVCERLGVPFALPLSGFMFNRAHAVTTPGATDGYVHYLGVEMKEHQRKIKRLFDVLASAAALAVLSPLLAAVAIAVKLSGKGPVLFRQTRSGLHGRPFQMLKFRSMRADAEALRAALQGKNEVSGPVFKMKNDPRVTAVGRFIRKYSIDELPQLFNVLKGEMSVVGPRPPLPSEVEKYESWQRRRLSVRPGLTCIWQVSGRSQISFEEWMKLDMQYIDGWSFMSDLRLVLRTVPVVLAGRGAS